MKGMEMSAGRSEAEIRDAVVQCLGYCGWEQDFEPELAKCLEGLRRDGWKSGDLENVAEKVRALCSAGQRGNPAP